MKSFELPLPDDFHVHLREGDVLEDYARDIAMQFGRALVMPNTLPAISEPLHLREYKRAIEEAAPNLTPLMTFKLNPSFGIEDLRLLQRVGALAGKYYPEGVTTNSQDGISEIESIFPVLAAMEELDIVLSIHAEEPGAFSLEREEKFLPKIDLLVKKFPKLRIMVEHLSSAAAVEAVLTWPETVAATITVHHLLLTLDDILGANLMPHHFCKPIVKRPQDRDALLKAAFSGSSKFFFGSDSAPHIKAKKEINGGAAGIYSAPVAMPLLMEIFEKADKLQYLPNFVAGFGADFYGLERSNRSLIMQKEAWEVPKEVSGVVPLAAGKTLQWQVKDIV
ncbi:MAG: dihydroorotase [Fibrobacter sp.]|nr:dihydroorotase [Fibrobacter sp.]